MTDALTPEPAIACDLGALAPEQRAEHLALVARVLGEWPIEVAEEPDGLAFRFDANSVASIATLVAQERLCCPFFRFVVDVAPQRGPAWLRISGPPGATAILGELVAASVARASEGSGATTGPRTDPG